MSNEKIRMVESIGCHQHKTTNRLTHTHTRTHNPIHTSNKWHEWCRANVRQARRQVSFYELLKCFRQIKTKAPSIRYSILMCIHIWLFSCKFFIQFFFQRLKCIRIWRRSSTSGRPMQTFQILFAFCMHTCNNNTNNIWSWLQYYHSSAH